MGSPNAGSSRQPAEAQTAGHTSERWIQTPLGLPATPPSPLASATQDRL